MDPLGPVRETGDPGLPGVALAALGVVAGVAAGSGLSEANVLGVAGAAGAVGCASSRSSRRTLVVVLCASFVVGVLRVHLPPWPSRPVPSTTRPVRVYGTVERTELRLGRDGRVWGWLEVLGAEQDVRWSILVSRLGRRWRAGDGIEAVVRPTGPGGLCNEGDDARARRRAMGFRFARASDDRSMVHRPPTGGLTPAVALARLRETLRDRVLREAPEEGRAGLACVLVGACGFVTEEAREAHGRAGTAHLLAISGTHIGVVAGAVFWLVRAAASRFRSWQRWASPSGLAAVTAAATAFGYAALAGARLPALRAAMMAGLGLAMRAAGRRTSVWAAPATAAVLLVLGDPAALCRPGFQLSFAAVIALIHVGASPAAASSGLGARASSLFASSVAVALATAPVTALHFGAFSLIGPLVNLIAIPLYTLFALPLGFAGLALAGPFDALGRVCLRAAALVLVFADRLAAHAASLPFAAVEGVGRLGLVLCIVVSAGLLPLVWEGTRSVGRRVVGGCLAAGLVGIAWLAVWAEAPHGVSLSVIDVGQGDALLLRGNDSVLIDAGGGFGSRSVGERVVLPAVRGAGVESLAVVALSHADRDHAGGVPAVLAGLAAGSVWIGRFGRVPFPVAAPVREVERGVASRVLGRGARLRVLHPGRGDALLSRNDRSVVLRLDYGAFAALLMGDVEADGERRLLRRGGRGGATVVKVAHHGSETSSTPAFVRWARPSAAVASYGRPNAYGMPSPRVRGRFEDQGALWVGTGDAGQIEIRSDGQLTEVSTCRP